MGTVSHHDLGEDPSFDDKIEAGIVEFFFKAEDLVADARFFRIGLF
jgi:hypothetical protein